VSASKGTDWRLHYVLRLPTLTCDFAEVTDSSGGETYTRVPVQAGDIILGDRGYCHREGVAHVIDRGGDAVVRLNANSFPLLDVQGHALDLVATLRTLDEHEPGSWDVCFRASGRDHAARLCAVRKSANAAERAKAQLRKTARRKKKSLRPETLELAEYIFVLATAGLGDLSATQVLELYRARWQVEVGFKRLKSLFDCGSVPNKDPDGVRTWIYAKLLAVLLIERLGEESRLFSPWGFPLGRGVPVAGASGGARWVSRRGVATVPAE
jgi:hypothetical protein